jgi:hypothetical protein
MNELIDPDLIRELSRDVVTRMAPQELPLFRIISDSYFRHNGSVPAARPGGDEMLGFGLESAALLLTPIVLPVISAVLDDLAENLARAVTIRGKDGLRRVLRLLLRRDAQQPLAGNTVPPISSEQLARVRQVAFEKARQLKLPDDKAELLADSVTGSLAAGR